MNPCAGPAEFDLLEESFEGAEPHLQDMLHAEPLGGLMEGGKLNHVIAGESAGPCA